MLTLSVRSVADLELISRVVFGGPSTNNDIPPLPFREVTLPKKLKFGYYTAGETQHLFQFTVGFANDFKDHYIKSSPACSRAVLETVDALRKAGHDCVEFDFPGGRPLCPLTLPCPTFSQPAPPVISSLA